MVARKTKSVDKKSIPAETTPEVNSNLEIDNRALRAKNQTLTEAVAKLKQDNAELQQQIRFIQGESFEVTSKYNNLKHVTSSIDATTRECLPKLMELAETFTGIMQMCSMAVNISNLNKDTRTQAVKPHAVNGHVLQDPTITLSRLSGDNLSPGLPGAVSRQATNPRSSRPMDGAEGANSEGVDDGEDASVLSENDHSFVSRARQGVSQRRQRLERINLSELQEDDGDFNEDELDLPAEDDENSDEEYSQRLVTIQEEEENELSSTSPNNSRNQTVLSGRFQEVKIYLNKLSSGSADCRTNNINISISPPEHRPSFRNRNSSLVGEHNESRLDASGALDETGGSPLDGTIRRLSRLREEWQSPAREAGRGGDSRIRTLQGRRSYQNPSPNKSARLSNTNISQNLTDRSANLNVNCTLNVVLEKASLRQTITDMTYTEESISAIQNFPSPSMVENDCSSLNISKSMAMMELGLVPANEYQPRTSTPILRRSKRGDTSNGSLSNGSYDSPRSTRSAKTRTPTLFNNSNSGVTKRKPKSEESRKVAQVILKRLSLEKRLSGSPIKKLKDIVNTPPLTVREIRNMKSKKWTRIRNGANDDSTSDEEEQENKSNKSRDNSSTRNGSPKKNRKKLKVQNMSPKKRTVVSTIKKSPVGRPARASRPVNLKEPCINRKMRRSK